LQVATTHELKVNMKHTEPSSTYGVNICKGLHFYKCFLLARFRCGGNLSLRGF